MELLKVSDKKDRIYTLESVNSYKKYKFLLNFYDLAEDVKVGNLIEMSEDLLNPNYEGYSKEYFFDSLNSKYGREIKTEQDVDLIKLITDKSLIMLKRVYG